MTNRDKRWLKKRLLKLLEVAVAQAVNGLAADDSPHPAKTPDELAEIRDKINNNTYFTEEQTKFLVGMCRLAADIMAQPPAPPDKAERIRECIKRIHAASENALIAHQRDGAHDWVIFRSDVWELIRLLELKEDDPDV